eukprot:gene6154-10161_t
METEDASELMFGDDFDNVQCLSLGEVQSILKEKQDEMQEEVFHDVFEKTLVYVNRFSKFENKETMKEIKNYLQKQGLHEFEMASLTNLVPPTIEEAKGNSKKKN